MLAGSLLLPTNFPGLPYWWEKLMVASAANRMSHVLPSQILLVLSKTKILRSPEMKQ